MAQPHSQASREQEMARLLRLFHQASSSNLKRAIWRKYAQLHSERTPEQVADLERARGLFRVE